MNPEEIPKPCPHCGAQATVVWLETRPRTYKVRCKAGNCSASGGTATTLEGAVTLWNRRVDGPLVCCECGQAPMKYTVWVVDEYDRKSFYCPDCYEGLNQG